MKSVTLKLYETLQLQQELEGKFNTQTNEKLSAGLVDEKLSVILKYWITDLVNKLRTINSLINNIKDELIKKHGSIDDHGNTIVSFQLADGSVNPKYLEFTSEFNTLLQEERTIESYEFKLAQFENLVTDKPLDVFFKILSID